MLKPLSFVLMFTVAAPAAAQITFQSAPTAAPPATAASTKDPNRVICERQEEIGSRLGGKKVCKTAAEWDEERRQQRDTVEKFQQQATGVPSSG
jgi:invasion protein IalB